jgi:hypothetical protein
MAQQMAQCGAGGGDGSQAVACKGDAGPSGDGGRGQQREALGGWCSEVWLRMGRPRVGIGKSLFLVAHYCFGGSLIKPPKITLIFGGTLFLAIFANYFRRPGKTAEKTSISCSLLS